MVDIERVMPLSWSPGAYADRHDVYFGRDPVTVANATVATAGIYRGRQDDSSYTPPEVLELVGN